MHCYFKNEYLDQIQLKIFGFLVKLEHSHTARTIFMGQDFQAYIKSHLLKMLMKIEVMILKLPNLPNKSVLYYDKKHFFIKLGLLQGTLPRK